MSARERRCAGVNTEGLPCQSPIVGEDGYCSAHRPGGEERMKRLAAKGAAASRRGGLDPDELGELHTHTDAQRWLEVIGRAVASGRLGDRAAQAAIRAVAEWVKAEGERATAEIVDELKTEIERLKRDAAHGKLTAL